MGVVASVTKFKKYTEEIYVGEEGFVYKYTKLSHQLLMRASTRFSKCYLGPERRTAETPER